jgi:mono/diheme cytochrome c family protein
LALRGLAAPSRVVVLPAFSTRRAAEGAGGFRVGVVGIVGLAIGALLAARGALAAEELKPGLGADATAANCSACHTSDYIVMNSTFLTPQAWTAEVTKMRSAFGAPIDDATAAEIAAYLAANYSVTP